MLGNYLEGSSAKLDGIGAYPGTLSISNLPAGIANNAGGFTVALYVAGQAGGETGVPSDYTLSWSGSATGSISTGNVLTGPISTFTAATATQEGNLLEFNNVPQGATNLLVTFNNNSDNYFSPLDGISIFTPYIDNGGGGHGTPEPGSMLLMALGALIWRCRLPTPPGIVRPVQKSIFSAGPSGPALLSAHPAHRRTTARRYRPRTVAIRAVGGEIVA